MAIDNIVGNPKQTNPAYLDKEKYGTQNIVDAWHPGDKYRFIIIPNMPEYQQPDVNPSMFQDRAKYRKFLIDKRKEFFQANTATVRDIMDKLGIEYICMDIVGMFAADLTKDQYQTLKGSDEIKNIEADSQLNLSMP